MGVGRWGTVVTRRLGLAAATLACLLAACAAWVGAAVSRPSDDVTVRVRARERQPATSAGHICSTDDAHGTICAEFVVGERPVDSLVVAIERRGFRPKIAP
jgi:hypothetical protein